MLQNQSNEKGYFNLKFHIIRISIYLVVGLVFALVLYFLNRMKLVNFLDASFITFWIFFGVGSLSIIGNLGTFDGLCYGFENVISSWRKGGKTKYKDLIEYKDIRQPKRHQRRFNFIDYYFVSSVFLIISIILEIIYYTNL